MTTESSNNFPNCHIAQQDGIPTIMVNEQPVVGMAFTPIWQRTTRDYLENLVNQGGIKIWYPLLRFAWPGRDDKQDDFELMNMIHAVDPEALMIPRFSLSPPPSWYADHPDECAVKGNSRYKERVERYSIASEVWWADAAQTMTRLIEQLNKQPWAHRIIGMYTGVGSNTEGGGWSSYDEKECYDFCPADRRAYTHYLKEQYDGDFEKVRELFHQPLWTSWEDVVQPPFEFRTQADLGYFHDPAGGGEYVRSYSEYQSWLNADRLGRIGAHIKKVSGNRLLYGTFHGYCGKPSGGPGNALLTTLKDPNIDIIGAPPNYDDRGPGGVIAFSMPIQSITARGKIFLFECDVRTSLAEPEQLKYGAPKTLDASAEAIRFYFGQCATQQSYGEILEPGRNEMSHQWHNHPQLLKTIGDSNTIIQKYRGPVGSLQPNMAVIWDKFGAGDTKSTMQTHGIGYHRSSPGDTMTRDWNRFEVPRIGAPVAEYLLEDLLDGLVPNEVTFLMFVCTWGMTSDQRDQLQRVLAERKNTELWFFAPGFVDRTQHRFSPENMASLTGMPIIPLHEDGPQRVLLTEEGKVDFNGVREPIGLPYRYNRTGLGLHSSFTATPPYHDHYAPTFGLKEGSDAEVLGRDRDSGAAAFCRTQIDGRTSYYLGPPFASCDLIRRIAAHAGVNIYLDTDDVVTTGHSLIMVHTKHAGERTMRLPTKLSLRDDDGTLYSDVTELSFKAPAGVTRFFRVEQN